MTAPLPQASQAQSIHPTRSAVAVALFGEYRRSKLTQFFHCPACGASLAVSRQTGHYAVPRLVLHPHHGATAQAANSSRLAGQGGYFPPWPIPLSRLSLLLLVPASVSAQNSCSWWSPGIALRLLIHAWWIFLSAFAALIA